MAIESLGTSIVPSLPSALPSAGKAATGVTGSFVDSLGRLVNAVESSEADSNNAIGKMLDGSGDVHDAMIAMQRADLTFQLSLQVRNKMVQAYQEIMRMPI